MKGRIGMKRSNLRRYLKEIVAEYESKPYDYWQSVALPITFERQFGSKYIQFEIHMLELTPEYVHIGFSADAGGISAYFPVGADIIVTKPDSADAVKTNELR
jgi:hypothetical protein